jgi:hypothetical protein
MLKRRHFDPAPDRRLNEVRIVLDEANYGIAMREAVRLIPGITISGQLQ